MAAVMAAFQERRVSRMAEWARTVSAFSLVLFVTAGVGHRYGLVETVAFLWTLALVAALALLGLALAAGGFSHLWRHGDKAGRASLAATLLSLFVLMPYAAGTWLYMRLPALTDISTDLEDPPRFTITARARTAGMNPIAPISNEAASLQMRFYPDLTGRRLDASVDRVLAALAPVHELAEELLERRAGRELRHFRPLPVTPRCHCLRGRDVHHRRQQPLGEIGETVGRRPGLGLVDIRCH